MRALAVFCFGLSLFCLYGQSQTSDQGLNLFALAALVCFIASVLCWAGAKSDKKEP